MKNVFLIGDSTRFGAPTVNSPGYGTFVKEILDGTANVYQPDDNCRFAAYTLRYLYEWTLSLPREEMDVVHWNNGLWELLHLNGDEAHTAKDIYLYYLKRVYSMLKKLFPRAKIIFSLSTCVKEEWASPNFTRYNSEIEEYNRAAAELMESLGVPVLDLYSISRGFDDSVRADWVHYKAEGCLVLAEAVADRIKKEL